ncbi:MAG TPA: hypothetical protein VFR71_04420 [Methyloceanibacter sp.]|nr:hypothetical protein [Methyloceanibacter sp.]
MSDDVKQNDLDKPIWGAANIAKVANLDERQTFYKLERKVIAATKCGSVWVSTPRKILKSLGVEC